MRAIFWIFLLAIQQSAWAQGCLETVPINVLRADTYKSAFVDPERLHASLGGRSVSLSNFQKISGNRILLLIDISRSMQDEPVRDLVKFMMEQPPERSSFAYGFFDETALLSDGFHSDPQDFGRFLEKVGPLEMRHFTALYDAIDQGIKLFDRTNPGDSILLISDGLDNRSKLPLSTLERELIESGLRLFAIMPLDSGVVLPPEGTYRRTEIPAPQVSDHPGVQVLSKLAEKSGGAVYPLVLNDVRWSVKQWRGPIWESLHDFWIEVVGGGYLVAITQPQGVKKPTDWKLRLDTKGDKQLQGASVLYPAKLRPCSNPATETH